MNIHQLSVSYVQEQDRLLLRVNSHAGDELRLWLTRRLMLGLMPALRRAAADTAGRVDSAPAGATPSAQVVLPDEHARQLMAEFERANVLKKADFQTPYQVDVRSRPLGQEPLLVTEVSLTVPHKGQVHIGFKELLPESGGPQQPTPRTLGINLEPQLLHALVHLLEQGIGTAQWLDNTTATPKAPAPNESAVALKPRYLN